MLTDACSACRHACARRCLCQSGTESRFIAWLSALKAEAIRAGVDAGTAEQALVRAVLPEVMELARNQPEFKMSWQSTRTWSCRRAGEEGRLSWPEQCADRPLRRSGGSADLDGGALWGIESN